MPISMESMLPFASFLAITLAVWVFLTAIAERPTNIEDRLNKLMQRVDERKAVATMLASEDRIQARMAQVAGRLGQSLRPKNEKELGSVKQKLLNAGFRGEHAVSVFYGVKFVGMLLVLGAAFPFVYSKMGTSRQAITYLILAAGAGFYLPDIIVGNLRKSRMEQIFLGLPDALDLMVVCVEAGLGLDTAMRRVTTELAKAWPTLCEEFAISLFQSQMGRARKDVLKDLGVRTGVDDMRALSTVIIQAEKFGSSIGSALRVQSDSMRVKRKQLAEERAAKTAVKIMIPMILFIFPGVFVVLVGPAGIQIATTMMK